MPLLCKVVDRGQKTKTKPNEWSERKGKSKQSPFYSFYILAASWSLRVARNQFYLVEMCPKVRKKMTTTTVPNSTMLWFRMGPTTTTTVEAKKTMKKELSRKRKLWNRVCHYLSSVFGYVLLVLLLLLLLFFLCAFLHFSSSPRFFSLFAFIERIMTS